MPFFSFRAVDKGKMMQSNYLMPAGPPMPNPASTKPGQILTALGLAAVMTAGLTAQAQTRAGSNGRALDANQQVGSGGVNPEDGRLDFSRRNDIITGNVGGGRGFQDDIGYGAVGEFTDTSRYGTSGRSDDFNDNNTLYDFRTGSLSSSTRYLNAASVGGVGQQSNFRVFRSFTNRAAQPQSPGLIAPQGGSYRLGASPFNKQLYSSRIRTDAFRDSANFMIPGRGIQAFTQAPGTGLDRVPILTSEKLARKIHDEAEQADDYKISGDITDSLRINTNVFDPFSKTKEVDKNKQRLQPGTLPPTMLIGRQLLTLIETDQANLAHPLRSQQVLDSVFNRLDKPDAEAKGASVYDQLLRDIRDGSKSDTGRNNLANTLESPTSQQLTEAELAYDEIMQQMYGEDYKTSRKDREADKDTESGDEEVRDVVDQLNYDLPRLATLAGDKRTRLADLTREAEAALANGKYLTAESRYRQILLSSKGDPLPRVGLIHAQLGAGMFRSAGVNLRALFVQHPELIAARYEPNLLPPESRMQWIQQELQSVISQGEGGKNAPLLLAYLGYQADSRQVVRYGMALAQSKSPRDPLLLVIREIWLDGAETSDGK